MNKLTLGVLTVGVTVSLMGISNPARASSFGYSLSINDPVFNPAFGNENVPDFRLENISSLSEGVQITDFNLTIGDTSFNYDFVASQSAFNDPSTDLGFTLNSPDLLNDINGSDAIDYDFVGFDPGDIFQFEADVDPDGISIVQDYRLILFPTAVLTVGFSNGETLSEILNPLDPNLNSYQFTQTVHRDVPEPSIIFGTLVCLGLGGAMGRKLSTKEKV